MRSPNAIVSRRNVLKTLGGIGLAAAMPGYTRVAFAASNADGGVSPSDVTDQDIFNFALNLESLETEYYLRGTTGHGMPDADGGASPGNVQGGRMVPWQNQELREFMDEVAQNELAHVRFYRRVLGSSAVSRPPIDLTAFTAAARAAGLGDNFDPFASEMNFFLGGMLMEDVGVTAYHGAAPLLKSKTNLDAAAGILGTEAYHMGMVRSTLYRMGTAARNAANAISDARDRLDGPGDDDQGIVLDGKANIVPTDGDAKVFSRTPQQVLRIVYLTSAAGVSGGGLFPKGMNGTLRTT